MLTTSQVRSYCIQNNLFTAGSNNQYNKMFTMVADGKPLKDIALVIWTCSSTTKSIENIEEDLKALSYEEEKEEKKNSYRAKLVLTTSSREKNGGEDIQSPVFDTMSEVSKWVGNNLEQCTNLIVTHVEINYQEYEYGLIKKDCTDYYYEW